MISVPKTVRFDHAIPEAHQKVFTTLLKVNAEKALNTTLRVAGGWVRDMLLGCYSNDIDIAIESAVGSPVSGEYFARVVSSFERLENGRARTVGVIRVNPALSKHIETATVCVCDIPVEFCALREDEYSAGSRIPEVKPGTLLGDALRRDFTINALFYNLSTNMVEDYTTGLEDLKARILRCPRAPRETFEDDPLRLLRGVRFVGQLSRFNFRLDSSIPACVDDKLLEKLTQKVSRERIGKEFTKMMSSPCPAKCVQILHDMRLLQNCILVEVYMKPLPGKSKLSSEVERVERLVDLGHPSCLQYAMKLNAILSPLFAENSALLFVAEKDRPVGMVFELVIPFLRCVDASLVEKRLYALCINGMKFPLRTFQCIQSMVNCFNTLHKYPSMLTDLQQEPLQDSTKLAIFEALGHLNSPSVIPNAFNIVLCTFVVLERYIDSPHPIQPSESIVDFYAPLWQRLETQRGLLDAYQTQLPVRGADLKNISGVELQSIAALLLDIRKKVMLNPEIRREEIIEWVKEVVRSE